MSPSNASRAFRTWVVRGAFLCLGFSSPVLAADLEVDGFVLGKTPCDEVIRTAYVRERDQRQAQVDAIGVDQLELKNLREFLRKPEGDKTPYMELYLERSRAQEADDLEALKKGPEACTPYGVFASNEMLAEALHIQSVEPIDPAALGMKQCPYKGANARMAPGPSLRGVVCLDGVLALYAKLDPRQFPQMKKELARTQGKPREQGLTANPIEDEGRLVSFRFRTGAVFRPGNGLIVLTTDARGAKGAVPVTRKGDGYAFKTPKLIFDGGTAALYLSKAALDVIEHDRKLHAELAGKMAAQE
jgi:hypothetical protein